VTPLLAAALALSAAHAADNTAAVFVTPAFGGGTGPFTQTETNAGPASAAGSATGGFGASGNASSNVAYGVFRLVGSGSAPIVSTARGQTRDLITVTSPGVLSGTPGTLTYRVRIGGFLSASSGSSGASWMLQTDIGGGAFDINQSANFYSPSLPTPGYVGAPFGTYTATVSFAFGFPLPFELNLRGTANSANASSDPGSASFGGPLSLDWLGITNVTANGSPVASFAVSSVSGTNWADDLTPLACDSIDFNNDGSSFDPTDIDAFLSVFSEGPCIPAGAMCGDVDFNNDGSLFDPCDIDSFLLVFSEGPCTPCGV
jgi:hypothetical protein